MIRLIIFFTNKLIILVAESQSISRFSPFCLVPRSWPKRERETREGKQVEKLSILLAQETFSLAIRSLFFLSALVGNYRLSPSRFGSFFYHFVLHCSLFVWLSSSTMTFHCSFDAFSCLSNARKAKPVPPPHFQLYVSWNFSSLFSMLASFVPSFTFQPPPHQPSKSPSFHPFTVW